MIKIGDLKSIDIALKENDLISFAEWTEVSYYLDTEPPIKVNITGIKEYPNLIPVVSLKGKFSWRGK